MQTNNVILRSRLINDDDLCASCTHLAYRSGETSFCMNMQFKPDWASQSNEKGCIQTCPEYSEVSPEFSKMLDELFTLAEKEYEGVQLTKEEEEKYEALVDELKSNDIEIPFGIVI